MTPWITAVIIIIVALFNILIWAFNHNSWLYRKSCCSWRRGPLTISNRAPWASRSLRPTQFWAFDLVRMTDLYDGFIGTPGITLYRLFCFGVFCFTIIFGRVRAGSDVYFMTYFTNWTYVLWAFTSIYGAGLTAEVWHHKRHPQQFLTSAGIPAANEPPQWEVKHKIHLLLLDTVAAASITLTVFFWAAVYDGKAVGFDNPMKHGVSAFLLLVEYMVCRAPLVSYHVQAPVAYGTLYLIFMWIYQAVTGKWLYTALNWTKPISIIFYIALPLLIILSFCVMFVVAGFRELFTTRKCFLGCSCCCASCGCCSCCRPDEESPVAAQVELPAMGAAAGASSKALSSSAAAYQAPESQRV